MALPHHNKATSVEVRYGSIDIDGGTSVAASRFIDHPQYNRSTQANDIGVVELPRPLNYQGNDSIQPICLGDEEDIPFGGKAIATGWGSTFFR
ncbi:serine protease [Penaeus vannamei]|uniref:Serine protease n=1 Tax=Penaeus vannamei TaxID=6689 RepID=A0A3R7LR25_PENVA|nr:serine protease [Penaeus vannamei]